MREIVLVLDQGTTGSTALALDGAGQIVGRAYAELTQSYPQPGWVEHDPLEIWHTSLRVLGEALERAGGQGTQVRALGVTNQRETTILWDRRTGRPVHPAVVWQSRQTAEICESLKRAGQEPLFRERTGLVVDAYFSATKARWILDAHPEAERAAAAGDVLFGTVDTWLVWKLTGGAVHATEPTNASRTLLFDIARRQWDDDLLRALDLPHAMLPAVKPSAGLFGETVKTEGLPAGIPIAGIAGDQQAALYGQGCWEAGLAKNTYGTGCFVMMNTGARRAKSPGGLLTTLCCDARGGPAYALEGSVFVAGAAIQWLRDGLGIIQRADETEGIARRVADTGGVYLVPAFAGLGAPFWDMHARGALLGLTRGSGRAEIVRAALESIAYQSRDVVDVMNADSGLPVRELRVDGGAAANDLLMQFQADILGVPVDRPACVETTALGAAYLAGLAVGLWPGPDAVAALRKGARRFAPAMPEERRQALYSGWRAAVARVRSPQEPGASGHA